MHLKAGVAISLKRKKKKKNRGPVPLFTTAVRKALPDKDTRGWNDICVTLS